MAGTQPGHDKIAAPSLTAHYPSVSALFSSPQICTS